MLVADSLLRTRGAGPSRAAVSPRDASTEARPSLGSVVTATTAAGVVARRERHSRCRGHVHNSGGSAGSLPLLVLRTPEWPLHGLPSTAREGESQLLRIRREAVQRGRRPAGRSCVPRRKDGAVRVHSAHGPLVVAVFTAVHSAVRVHSAHGPLVVTVFTAVHSAVRVHSAHGPLVVAVFTAVHSAIAIDSADWLVGSRVSLRRDRPSSLQSGNDEPVIARGAVLPHPRPSVGMAGAWHDLRKLVAGAHGGGQPSYNDLRVGRCRHEGPRSDCSYPVTAVVQSTSIMTTGNLVSTDARQVSTRSSPRAQPLLRRDRPRDLRSCGLSASAHHSR